MVEIWIVPIKTVSAALIMSWCIYQYKPSLVARMLNHRFIPRCAEIDSWISDWLLAVKDIYKLSIIIFWKKDVVMRKPSLTFAGAKS